MSKIKNDISSLQNTVFKLVNMFNQFVTKFENNLKVQDNNKNLNEHIQNNKEKENLWKDIESQNKKIFNKLDSIESIHNAIQNKPMDEDHVVFKDLENNLWKDVQGQNSQILNKLDMIESIHNKLQEVIENNKKLIFENKKKEDEINRLSEVKKGDIREFSRFGKVDYKKIDLKKDTDSKRGHFIQKPNLPPYYGNEEEYEINLPKKNPIPNPPSKDQEKDKISKIRTKNIPNDF